MKKTILLLSYLFFYSNVMPQQSGPQYYRSAVIDGNNIKTVFGNWGVLGQPSDSRPHGAWMHSTNGYIGDESILFGLEFPIQDYNSDGKPDTVHSVITCPVSRPASSLDRNPSTGEPWTFMPESTSVNLTSQSLPISNDTSSWPNSWTNGLGRPAWKGLFETGKIFGAQEAYFAMNDNNDHRFDTPANNPYNNNFTGISGHGIHVEVRYLQFNDNLLNDVLFRIYDITNLGKINYPNVVFGSLMGTYVGITGNNHSPGEYDDDYSIMMKKEGVIITGDFNNDCSRNPSWNGTVGKYGVGFIDAPMNNELGSFSYFTATSQIPLGNDEKLWAMIREGNYSSPGNVVNDTLPVNGADGDFIYGSYRFSLDVHQTRRIATVLAYGYSNAEVLQNVDRARKYYTEKLKKSPSIVSHNSLTPAELSLLQNYPNPFNPSTTIRYSLPSSANVKLTIHDILGREIATLVNEEQSAGWKEVKWNAKDVSSGIYFYKLAAGDYVGVKKLMVLK